MGKLISSYPHDDDITLYHYARLIDRYGTRLALR